MFTLLSIFVVVGCKDFNDYRTSYTSEVCITFVKFGDDNCNLYLMPTLVKSELKHIPEGQNIVLTNTNKVYFVINGKLLSNKNGKIISYQILDVDRIGIPKTKLELEQYQDVTTSTTVKDFIKKMGLNMLPTQNTTTLLNKINVIRKKESGEKEILGKVKEIKNRDTFRLPLDIDGDEVFFIFKNAAQTHQNILHLTYKKITSLISPPCGMVQAYTLEEATFDTITHGVFKPIFVVAPIIKNPYLQKKKEDYNINVEIYF